jgi:hypothetical protein
MLHQNFIRPLCPSIAANTAARPRAKSERLHRRNRTKTCAYLLIERRPRSPCAFLTSDQFAPHRFCSRQRTERTRTCRAFRASPQSAPPRRYSDLLKTLSDEVSALHVAGQHRPRRGAVRGWPATRRHALGHPYDSGMKRVSSPDGNPINRSDSRGPSKITAWLSHLT